MWHWLQKRLSKRALLLSKLVCFTMCMHGLLFVMSLLVYELTSTTTLVINVARKIHPDATIVVMPLQKRITQPLVAASKPSQRPAKPQPVKKVAPAKKPATTLAVAKKPEPVVAQPKKVAPKPQPATPKTATPAKKIEPEKKVVQKTPPPKPEPQQEVAKKEVTQPVLSQPVQELPALAYAQQKADLGDDGVVYIGREDAQMLKIHDEIVQELHKHWQSPVGMTSDCSCLVNVRVTPQGVVADVHIEKPSGVLVYDIAARSAVLAMEMPKWVWGKRVSIAFNQ